MVRVFVGLEGGDSFKVRVTLASYLHYKIIYRVQAKIRTEINQKI